ncbi:RNA polymerase sigma factor [Methyloradius palustris]|uniref:RNA polymerase sigma factor n=2 Tax=Methyloradius palustris TaxID=2778876 RepID=A0A8D5K095_9PROT|nr:RNA polymerase sigma factor [Methyloradius palustris]
MNLMMNEMYSSHHAWLHGWLRKRLASSDVAADLAQDTFVSVLTRQNKEQEDVVINEPRAYLTTIAKCILSNYFQRKNLEEAYNEALANIGLEVTISAEDKLILLETLQEIDAMLDKLPVKVRQAFLLHHLDGANYSEIALKLDISDRTVTRYMAQAFEQCLLHML